MNSFGLRYLYSFLGHELKKNQPFYIKNHKHPVAFVIPVGYLSAKDEIKLEKWLENSR